MLTKCSIDASYLLPRRSRDLPDQIQDHTGEKILGRFYENELSVIKKKDDVFRIDKVLRTKTVRGKKMSLVSDLTNSRAFFAILNK